jgi:hypothetical protein
MTLARRKGGLKTQKRKGRAAPKQYRRLTEEEWRLVRYAIVREHETVVATAALFDVSERTIANRRKKENWNGIDPFKSYVGLPTDEEVLEMRSQYLVNKTMKSIHDKLGQLRRNAAAGKEVDANELKLLADAAGTLESKLRRRAPSGKGPGVDSVRAGRKAPSVEDAIAILDSRAARRRASRAAQELDGE